MAVMTRMLEERDLDRVCELEARSFSMPWKKEDFADLIERDECIYLVIVHDDLVIGTAGYTFNGFEGYINNVVIDEAYRGNGYARLLMSDLLSHGREKGVNDFTLEVRVSNTAANRLYESLGFESAGIRKKFYERPVEDANVMWLRYTE